MFMFDFISKLFFEQQWKLVKPFIHKEYLAWAILHHTLHQAKNLVYSITNQVLYFIQSKLLYL